MKKSMIIISVFTMLFLVSCMSTSFVPTGNDYNPLPENTKVKIVIDGNNDLTYDEIGVIEVRESIGNVDFSSVVDKASDIAKTKGANCIIYMNRSSSVSGSADVLTTTNQYFFKAVKLR